MADIQIENGGTIFLFRPLTDKGRQWLDLNTTSEPWQWFEGSLAVEWRYAAPLAIAAQKDGVKIT